MNINTRFVVAYAWLSLEDDWSIDCKADWFDIAVAGGIVFG